MFNLGETCMKKSLVALAALAAGTAFAQSSVTMYGNVDIGYGNAVTKTLSGATRDVTSGVVDGVLMPNRIGFRGTEDLGSGLTAGFVLEQGLSPVSNNGWNLRTATSGHQVPQGGAFSSATMRAGNLFVAGGFGEVRIGTFNRAAYGVASKSIVMAENYGGEGHTLASTRTTAIGYTSPSFNGVTAQIQYGSAHGQRITQEISTDSSSGLRIDNTKVLGTAVNYNAGPLYLGVAYEATDVYRTANAATTTNAYGGTVSAGTAVADRTEKLYALAASYDFGVAKVNFSHVDRDQVASGTAKSYNVSATVPVGAVTLAAIYTKEEQSSQAGAATKDLKGYQIGAIYNLSKRSQVYVWRGHDKDTLASSTSLADRTRTVIGMQHSF